LDYVDKINAEIDSSIILNESKWEALLVENTNEERNDFLSHLLIKAQGVSDVEEKLNCYRLANFLKNKYDLQTSALSMYMELGTIGFEAYKNGDKKTAEIAFAILSENGDSNGRNNYAYMIRRKETTENSETMLIKAIQLLKEGIIQKESFSYVNLALLLALRCGKDSDWKFADELVEKMPDDNVSSVQGWWEDVGNSGDIEGLLVHFFLLRHGKIKKSVFGDMEQLSKKLSNELDNFPDWLIVLPRFSSLDDLFETMLDDDFEENLSQYLEKMPRDRKAAEEILEEMTQWDEWELYRILLQEYMEFLSPEEVAKTVQAYRKKFMIPLSSIIDENDLKIADEASTED